MKSKYFLFSSAQESIDLFNSQLNVTPYDFWVCDLDQFNRVKKLAEEAGYVFVHRHNQMIRDQEYITYQCMQLWDYIDSQ